MATLRIETNQGQTSFRPGDSLTGLAQWRLDRYPKQVELRLFWYTEGKGDQDVEVVEALAFDQPQFDDEREFAFSLPQQPYSFSGKLISLLWALELVVDNGAEVERLDITLSPTGEEVLLYPDQTSQADDEGQG